MTAIKITPSMDRAAWLAERKNGIGGSDVAAVLGLNPYKTPLDLWEEKTGRTPDQPAGESAYWGNVLEEVVAKEFKKRTGMAPQRVNSILTTGENGWMRGNIDRAIVNPEISGRVSVLRNEKAKEAGRLLSTDLGLECKTASVYMADKWGPSQEDEILAGKMVTEHKIPLYYETQVQWYMAVTGIKTFFVAVLIGGQDFRVYRVDRNQAVISLIVQKCEDFWQNHVLKDVPPEPINVADIKKLYQKDDGEMVEANTEQAIDIGELRNINGQIKTLEDQKKAVASRLIMAIGEKSGLTLGGEKAVTYKASSTTRFSSTAFRKDHPDLYEDYAKTTTTRTLRLA